MPRAGKEAVRAAASRTGTYALILHAPAAARIEIGRLGVMEVRPGFYVYVGSAFGPGGIEARIAHHRRTLRRRHWHIDYLRTAAEVREAWISRDPIRREHAWAEVFRRAPGAAIPVPHFGASDCACRAHLVFFPRRPSSSIFRRRLHAACPGQAPVRVVRWISPPTAGTSHPSTA